MMAAPCKTAKKTVARATPVKKVAAKKLATGAARKPAVRKTAARVDTAPGEDVVALVERVARAVDRELAEVEGIVGSLQGKSRPTEAERRARTLASLARTLSEVRRLRAADETQMPDDVDRPRDLEELRQRLSGRLAQMVETGEASPADGLAEARRNGTA
jgi:hypothetical protein